MHVKYRPHWRRRLFVDFVDDLLILVSIVIVRRVFSP